MTRKTFYKKLSQTLGSFTWKLTREGKIRGQLKDGGGKYYCPITAVNKLVNEKYERLYNVADAAYDLGIYYEDEALIVLASDNQEKTPLRRTLLKRVGLL